MEKLKLASIMTRYPFRLYMIDVCVNDTDENGEFWLADFFFRLRVDNDENVSIIRVSGSWTKGYTTNIYNSRIEISWSKIPYPLDKFSLGVCEEYISDVVQEHCNSIDYMDYFTGLSCMNDFPRYMYRIDITNGFTEGKMLDGELL